MSYSVLYIGTAAMFSFASVMIIFVFFVSNQFKIEKEYNAKRDKFYMQRLDDIEAILRNEILELINKIKKK